MKFYHKAKPITLTLVVSLLSSVCAQAQAKTIQSDNMCYPSDPMVLNLSPTFNKVSTSSEDDISHYKGKALLKGHFTFTDPSDEYTPCGICFEVDEVDAYKIPRDINDDRKAWFGFNNIIYSNSSQKVKLSGIELPTDKCFAPAEAIVMVDGYMTDKTPTETIDKTTLKKIVTIAPIIEVDCSDNEAGIQ